MPTFSIMPWSRRSVAHEVALGGGGGVAPEFGGADDVAVFVERTKPCAGR